MTNSRTDSYNNRVSTLGPGEETVGVTSNGSVDPTGQYPTRDYFHISTVNQLSYGAQTSDLSLGGGANALGFSVEKSGPSDYSKNRIIATDFHTIEMDDTPGKQRILIKHKTGNGIEFRSDGSMVIAAGNQTVSVSKNQQIVIEGDATIVYGGNIDMQVAGDFNLQVGGSYNVSVGENLATSVEGAMRTTVDNNVGLTVKGSKSETVLKTSTTTVLGDNNTITKGVMRNTSQGNMQLSSGDTTHISGKNKLFQSADNMNIAASNLSVFGSTGIMGGEGVTLRAQTASADTFYGDLKGTAETAITADVANSQNYADPDVGGGVGSASGYTVTETALAHPMPVNAVVSDYLTKTSVGAVDVKVDIGNHFLKSIDKSTATGGLANKDLTTAEYRAHLRQEYNLNNQTVTGNAVATGKLSADYAKTTPDEIGRVSSKGTEAIRGENKVGKGFAGDSYSKFKAPQDNTSAEFTPEFVIQDNNSVLQNTKLADGITIATFTGAKGQLGNINKVPTANRPQIARNLQPNAEILKRIRDNSDKDFADLRLVPIEAVYNPTAAEQSEAGWKNSINYYRSKGRAVVYELIDSKGAIAYGKTFDLAVKLKNTNIFQKLILDHDNFDPNGKLNTQLILIMPNLDENYNVTDGNFSREIETRYNGKVMSSSDIVEIPVSNTR